MIFIQAQKLESAEKTALASFGLGVVQPYHACIGNYAQFLRQYSATDKYGNYGESRGPRNVEDSGERS